MLKSTRLVAYAALALVGGATGLYFAFLPTPQLVLTLGCGEHQQIKIDLVPLTSMDIKTPIYGLDNKGKLFKLNPGSGDRTLLSAHDFYATLAEFDFGATIVRSADGRWIGYSHAVGDRKTTQYWLYDTQLSSDRLALQTPSGTLEQTVQFSPDGKLLAVAADYAPWWPDAKMAGIYVIETATLKPLRIELPSKLAVKDTYTQIDWSADGKALLVGLANRENRQAENEFFAWRRADDTSEAIASKREPTHDRTYRTQQGMEIPIAPKLEAQSDAFMLDKLASPSGNWLAQLRKPNDQGKFALELRNKGGLTKTAFSAEYRPCDPNGAPEGPTPLSIIGWLDEQHLVYVDANFQYYVFDNATGYTALLFDGHTDTRQFLW